MVIMGATSVDAQRAAVKSEAIRHGRAVVLYGAFALSKGNVTGLMVICSKALAEFRSGAMSPMLENRSSKEKDQELASSYLSWKTFLKLVSKSMQVSFGSNKISRCQEKKPCRR